MVWVNASVIVSNIGRENSGVFFFACIASLATHLNGQSMKIFEGVRESISRFGAIKHRLARHLASD